MSDETIGLLLAINSGILSVVGLITIFISMNSQHSVQYSREILWGIFTLPYKKNLFLDKQAIGQEVFRKFILYEQIIKDKNAFLIKIITFSQMVLTFSIIIWTTIVLNLLIRNPSLADKIILLLGLSLALCFIFYFILKILGDLKSVSKVGKLPTVEELLNADFLANNLNVITLAAVSARLKILDSNIYLGFPIPFKNLRVKITLQQPQENENHDTANSNSNHSQTLTTQLNSFRKLDLNDFKLLDDDYCYYLMSDLHALGVSGNSFLVTVDLLSRQGLVAAEFYCESLTNNHHKLIFPYSFVERFINRQSDLDPFSRYQKNLEKTGPDRPAEKTNLGRSLIELMDDDQY
ncbi:hypothetical protein [Desulfosporosinus sp. FKA]|uniref:hypothetical protein n=1 Tax=Desulfosporosinus sp. FKA TaxID=1969834 RepID=UPI000B4A5530|nr:hypothetical protein [Desulfosporosinus sp. FKA]